MLTPLPSHRSSCRICSRWRIWAGSGSQRTFVTSRNVAVGTGGAGGGDAGRPDVRSQTSVESFPGTGDNVRGVGRMDISRVTVHLSDDIFCSIDELWDDALRRPLLLSEAFQLVAKAKTSLRLFSVHGDRDDH